MSKDGAPDQNVSFSATILKSSTIESYMEYFVQQIFAMTSHRAHFSGTSKIVQYDVCMFVHYTQSYTEHKRHDC